MNKKYEYLVSAQKVVKPGDTLEIKEVNNMRTFTDEELRVITKKHMQYLNGELDGRKADLSDADLRGANLRGANLRGADLIDADLSDADLRGANLRGANLSDADLRGANLRGANLREADLREADFREADLREADLREADLRGADLRGADLRGADLRGADLSEANLRGADLSEASLRGADFRGANLRKTDLNLPMACPSEGSFIGWKKALLPQGSEIFNHFCLIKLEIPADAKRSSGTSTKCRTNKAKVLEIYSIQDETQANLAFSIYDNTFVYRKGETVEVVDFDDDRFNECSTGIHFFIDREEAIHYIL